MPQVFFQLTPRTLKQLKSGSDDAWQEFFDAFDPTIRSVAAWPKWRFDPQAQSEVVQTAKSEIVRAIAHLDQPGHVTAFVKRICVRRCIDEVRRQIRNHRLVPLVTRSESGEWQNVDVPTDENFDPVELIVRKERRRPPTLPGGDGTPVPRGHPRLLHP
jgi:DNA-directed RNA polymerase specialized sigma24 family protein